MAASTPTLDSELAASPATAPAASSLNPVKLTLAGASLLAVLLFALYAAYLASRVEDVIAPIDIAVPSKGATSPLGLGQSAPDFALTDVDGKPVKLSDFAGRPVWVNVWASWCAPCRAEMPDLDAVYRDVRKSDPTGLALLVVSLGEDPAVVRRYLSTTKYELPVLLDPTFSFTEHYRITGLPTHFFIDRRGVIKDLAIGGLKPNGMRARLAKILSS